MQASPPGPRPSPRLGIGASGIPSAAGGSSTAAGVGVGASASASAASAAPAPPRVRGKRALDCSAWAMFLLPYALLLFFATVFFWARASALAALVDEAGASAPRFAAALAGGRWPDAAASAAAFLPGKAEAAAPLPTVADGAIALLQLGEYAYGGMRHEHAAAAPISRASAPPPSDGSLLPAGVGLFNPLLGALAHMLEGGGGGGGGGGARAARSHLDSLPRFRSLGAFESSTAAAALSPPVSSSSPPSSLSAAAAAAAAAAPTPSLLTLAGAASAVHGALERVARALSDPYTAPFPHHVEMLGIVLEAVFLLLTAACLVITHVTPPGGWEDVAERIACGEIERVEDCFREWKETTAVVPPPGAAEGHDSPPPLADGETRLGAALGKLSGEGGPVSTLRALQALTDAGVEMRRRHRAAEAAAKEFASRGAAAAAAAAAEAAAATAAATDAASSSVAAETLHLLDPSEDAAARSATAAAVVAAAAPPPLDLPPALLRVCAKCEWPAGTGRRAPKPDRAHHCRHCGTCVLEMDHHCPWIANCVGAHNKKHFLLLIVYAVLGLVVFLVWMAPNFLLALQNLVSVRRQAVYLFAYFLAIFLALLLVGFLGFHAHLVVRGLTTIEWCEKVRPAASATPKVPPPPPPPPADPRLQLQEAVADGAVQTRAVAGEAGGEASGFDLMATTPVDLLELRDDDFSAMPQARFLPLLRSQLYLTSPYDIGIVGNVRAVFGRNPLFWLIPAKWSLEPTPPYEASQRFLDFRRRIVAREAWRAVNASKVAMLDRAWRAARGKVVGF